MLSNRVMTGPTLVPGVTLQTGLFGKASNNSRIAR